MQQLNKVIKEAYRKGYRVTKEGKLLNPKGKELSVNPDKQGYLRASFFLGQNKIRGLYVHKLVAYQKFGEKIFEKGICVRHLKGGATNNTYDNILIDTLSDNMFDQAPEIRRRKSAYANRKYDSDTIKSIRDFYETCGSYKKTMEQFSISSKGTLNYILKNDYL